MNAAVGLLPLWIASGGALVLLSLEVLAGEKGRRAAPWVGASIVLLALSADLFLFKNVPGPLFSGAVVVDTLALFIGASVLFACLSGIVFGAAYLQREKAVTCEYYALLLLSVSGALVLSAAGDLLTVLVGLELMSLPAYVLAGYLRRKSLCVEAAIKYYLPGVAATAFLAYGSAMVYGATGSLSFEGIRLSVVSGHASPFLLMAGAVLVMATFAFKVAVVPFHAWVLDTYEGAPAPVSAFLNAAIKAAAFTAWLRFFRDAFPPNEDWGWVLGLLAVVTMAVGNFGALAQVSVKRMLAYSSVSQAGYILVGLATIGQAPSGEVSKAVSFYLLAYAFMSVGAFGWLARAAGDGEHSRTFDAFRGYGRKHPVESAFMSLFLLSLAGVPPTAGFFGKVLLFKLAVSQGYIVLALVAMVFSLLAFAYYLRLIVVMYMDPLEPSEAHPADEGSASPGLLHRVGLGLCALGTLLAGFFPLPF
jgi:NADH-quinone oxidoreductase subunit N